MAFTPQQDVSGAAAFEQAVSKPSSLSALSSIGQNLFKLNDTAQREGAARDKAAATAAAKTVFSTTLKQIDYDINTTGLNQDAIADKYGSVLAEMDLNENQESLISQKLGRNIFYKQPSTADLALEAFANQETVIQQGQVAIEMNKAKAAGKPITEGQAVQIAIASYSLNTQASAVAAAQGAMDFTVGFEGNIKTIRNFKDAVLQGLSVETAGDDLDLKTLRRLQDGFLVMKSQKGFSEPTDAAGKELYKQMETEFKTIQTLFEKLVDYDANAVDARTKQMVAQIVLAGGDESELAQLALQNPQVLAGLRNKSLTTLVDQIKAVKDLKSKTYADLNFTPDVLALMGIDAETPLTVEQAFPDMEETYVDWTDKQFLAKLGKEEMVATISGGEGLATKGGRDAYATSISTRSFILSKMKSPSVENYTSLFSDKTFKDLSILEGQGAEGAKTANILRNQMKTALDAQEGEYSVLTMGKINAIEGLGFSEDTNEFMITSTDDKFQDIESVAQMYFGGDIHELLKKGSTANIVLSRNERAPVKNSFYSRFLGRFGGERDTSDDLEVTREALIVLSGPTFRRLREGYNTVSKYPAMRQKFKDDGKKLGLTPAATPEPVRETPKPAPTITETSLGGKLGQAEDTPYTIKTQEEFDNLPDGSWYRNPTDGLSYKKKSGGE